jgi:hypothetical protein
MATKTQTCRMQGSAMQAVMILCHSLAAEGKEGALQEGTSAWSSGGCVGGHLGRK